jgi:hypothetical protein
MKFSNCFKCIFIYSFLLFKFNLACGQQADFLNNLIGAKSSEKEVKKYLLDNNSKDTLLPEYTFMYVLDLISEIEDSLFAKNIYEEEVRKIQLKRILRTSDLKNAKEKRGNQLFTTWSARFPNLIDVRIFQIFIDFYMDDYENFFIDYQNAIIFSKQIQNKWVINDSLIQVGLSKSMLLSEYDDSNIVITEQFIAIADKLIDDKINKDLKRYLSTEKVRRKLNFDSTEYCYKVTHPLYLSRIKIRNSIVDMLPENFSTYANILIDYSMCRAKWDSIRIYFERLANQRSIPANYFLGTYFYESDSIKANNYLGIVTKLGNKRYRQQVKYDKQVLLGLTED